MASLFTLMPAGAGPIPLERLEAAADTEDVLVDCLIDEELYWLRTGSAVVDPVYDEPYLSGLSTEARQSAIDSGLRALIAKGMVDVDPEDTSAVEVLGVYGLLSDCRSQARSVTRVLLEVRDEPPIRYAFHRISETLVLVEEVSEDGFHDFTFQSLDSAAASLSSIFDRRRTAGAESGRHIRAASPEDLEPSPEELRPAAAHVVTLTSKGTAVDGRTRELAMTVFGMADGVWAHWVEVEAGPVHVMAQAGSPDLFVLAADAIAGRTSSR